MMVREYKFNYNRYLIIYHIESLVLNGSNDYLNLILPNFVQVNDYFIQGKILSKVNAYF